MALRCVRAAVLAGFGLAAYGGAQAQSYYQGEMRAFAFGFCPKDWRKAEGQILPSDGNSSLFTLLGSTYGLDSMQTFHLPDMRGRAPLGMGPEYSLGQKEGAEASVLLARDLPMHTHPVIATTVAATHGQPTQNALLGEVQNAGLYVDATAADTTLAIGGGYPDGVPVLDPLTAITWCVAIDGTYPSRP